MKYCYLQVLLVKITNEKEFYISYENIRYLNLCKLTYQHFMKLSAAYEESFPEKSRRASEIQITLGNIWKKMEEDYTYKKEEA